MKIVLLEPLAVKDEYVDALVRPFLDQGHTFTRYGERGDLATQISRVREADVLILANMPLPAEVIRAAPRLKFIDIAFTGVDHVDLQAARAQKAAVSNASGYSTDSVAELALGLMLALIRNVPKVEQRCRAGQTKEGLVGREIKGKTVGLVGLGAIGGRTAELCRAFGAEVIAYRRQMSNPPAGLSYVPLDDLLRRSDIVSLHCPLTDETRHLINRERLALMKSGAYLINTARGPVVETAALAQALREGRLAGAGLDVFEAEPPLPRDHPLFQTPNTIVTPHVAFATEESLRARARIVFDNLKHWLAGDQINVIAS